MNALIRQFTDDPTVRLVAALVALDFILGIAAAFRAGTFRLGWLSDFLRRDVLGKLVPYFAVWAAVRLGGDLELAGVGAIEETVGLAVVASVGASILNSLRDLGVLNGAPDALAGSDTPPPAP
jgi:hypothetical protein